jgi:hypothetical protein
MSALSSEELELLSAVSSELRLLVSREGPEPCARSIEALDGLGLASEDCPARVSTRAVAELGTLAPELAAAFVGVHPAWRRPPIPRAIVVAARQGLLWYLLHQVRQHTELRVMFGKRLAEQPVIRLRLVAVAAHLAWSEYLAERIESPGVPAMLQDVIDAVCTVLQLTCGGTGYMVESAVGQAIQWLEACEQSLGASGEAPAPPGLRERWIEAFLTDASWTVPLDATTMAWLLEDQSISC